MHGNAQPKLRGGPPTNGEAFAGGFDISGEHADEKNAQAQTGEGTRARHQDANGTQNFADSGEVNHGHGIGNSFGHHAREVVTHFCEMG